MLNNVTKLAVARLNNSAPPRKLFDYDGDGKADIAVFRPSTGIWYLLQTTSGFGAAQWGTSGDVPTENAFIPQV
jgi:hypothetical protein